VTGALIAIIARQRPVESVVAVATCLGAIPEFGRGATSMRTNRPGHGAGAPVEV